VTLALHAPARELAGLGAVVADLALALAAYFKKMRLAAALFALFGSNWTDYTNTPL